MKKFSEVLSEVVNEGDQLIEEILQQLGEDVVPTGETLASEEDIKAWYERMIKGD